MTSWVLHLALLDEDGDNQLFFSDTSWMHQAACSSPSGELLESFFAEDESDGMSTRQVYGAKYHCVPCPVRADCLQWAMDVENGQALPGDGVFGGLTPNERNFASQADDPIALGLHVFDEQVRLGLVDSRVPRYEEARDVAASSSGE